MLLGGLPVALIHTENTLHPGVSITDNEVGINTTEHVHCLYVVHVYMYTSVGSYHQLQDPMSHLGWRTCKDCSTLVKNESVVLVQGLGTSLAH